MLTHKKAHHKAQILKVGIDSTREMELLKQVEVWIEGFRANKDGKRLIFTPNPEMLVDAWSDKSFLRILNSSDLNIADGVGLKWANIWLRLTRGINSDQNISERITGVDLSLRLVKLAARRGWRVYLLGSAEGVATKAKKKLEKEMAGESAHGFEIFANAGPAYGIAEDAWQMESDAIVAEISKLQPEILLVAFGHRKQETWLVENRERMKFGVGVGVGGTLDYISGRIRRAPALMRLLGLEWLFRLFTEPKRWRRIWKAVVVFPWLVMREGGR